jgi:hypothetical protein
MTGLAACMFRVSKGRMVAGAVARSLIRHALHDTFSRKREKISLCRRTAVAKHLCASEAAVQLLDKTWSFCRISICEIWQFKLDSLILERLFSENLD